MSGGGGGGAAAAATPASGAELYFGNVSAAAADPLAAGMKLLTEQHVQKLVEGRYKLEERLRAALKLYEEEDGAQQVAGSSNDAAAAADDGADAALRAMVGDAVRCERAAEAALAQMVKLGESDARFPSLLADFNRWMDAADAAHAANRDGDSDHNDDE
jgi:hypothetical protein